MRNPFHPNGHLTDDALHALIDQIELDELTRLELSEHLAYCDVCLQRYTNLLTDDVLAFPAQSCRDTLWTRVRQQAAKIFLSRYATAVAAVGLALLMVWSDIKLPERVTLPSIPASGWTEPFDHHASLPKSQNLPPVHQGGRHS